MTDGNHVAFELTLEALTGIVVYPLLRLARRRLVAAAHAQIDAAHGITHDCPTSPRARLPLPLPSNCRLVGGAELDRDLRDVLDGVL